MTEVPEASASLPAAGKACVYVIGMHRSGTSAVAGLLARLGLASPPEHDQIPATRSNTQGHFESRQLVAFNHRLLVRLGGSWTSPPDLAPGWEAAGELGHLREEASDLFALTFPWRPAAWKDPRLCLLLPFWRTVVEPPAAAVFVCRHPGEVAMSLKARDGLGALLAHALWERYVRLASRDLHGLPTLVADYGRILGDPVGWSGQLVQFLAEAGVEARVPGADDVRSLLDSARRRQRAEDGDADELGDSSHSLFDALRALHGPHVCWRPPELGEEPAWVADVLSLRRRLDMLRYGLGDVERSRAYRLAAWARGRRQSA